MLPFLLGDVYFPVFHGLFHATGKTNYRQQALFWAGKRGKSATLGYVKMSIPTTKRGRGMFMKVGKKRFGWLAGLALWPVVGWGQEFLVHPQNQTVCVGKAAIFTSLVDVTAGSSRLRWLVNGVTYETWRNNAPLPSGVILDIVVPDEIRFTNFTTRLSLVFNPNTYIDFFNGLEIKVGAVGVGGLSDTSNTAYLFYKTNQQSPVTGLPPTIDGTAAQLGWNKRNSSFPVHYLSGVYDRNNNQVANQTTNTTHASFDLPSRADDTCQSLEFRVTAVEVQHPECPDIEQTNYSAYLYIKPDVSPVTAEFDGNQTVLVSWTPDGGSAFQIVVTDLGSGNQTAYNSTQPFSYMAAGCGQYSLNISVSPAQCANDPAFTHSDTVSFAIPCPTTPTEATETGGTDQPSGTQASYPSVLLAVAAIIPLLKWQH